MGDWNVFTTTIISAHQEEIDEFITTLKGFKTFAEVQPVSYAPREDDWRSLRRSNTFSITLMVKNWGGFEPEEIDALTGILPHDIEIVAAWDIGTEDVWGPRCLCRVPGYYNEYD
jgi:hypothetical protein